MTTTMQHRAVSALALELLASGRVREYEYASERGAEWLDVNASPEECLRRSLVGWQDVGKELKVRRGEAEAAKSLAALYRRQVNQGEVPV